MPGTKLVARYELAGGFDMYASHQLMEETPAAAETGRDRDGNRDGDGRMKDRG